jgi:hypothetical protein
VPFSTPAFNTEDDSHHKRLLRGAVAEYLDEGNIVTFLTDLKAVLVEEEDRFMQQALWFRAAHDKLFKTTPAEGESTPEMGEQ